MEVVVAEVVAEVDHPEEEEEAHLEEADPVDVVAHPEAEEVAPEVAVEASVQVPKSSSSLTKDLRVFTF